MRSDIKYMSRVGEVGIGKIQRRVLAVLRRSRVDLTVREIAEIVYRKELSRECSECGRPYKLTESQLVVVRQAILALYRRGVISEPRIEE